MISLEGGTARVTPQGFIHVTNTATGHYFASPGELCYITSDTNMSLLENNP